MGGPGDAALKFQAYNRLKQDWSYYKDVKNYVKCNELRTEIIYQGRQIGIPDTDLPIFPETLSRPVTPPQVTQPVKPPDNYYQGDPYKPDSELSPQERKQRDEEGARYSDWFTDKNMQLELIQQWKNKHPNYTNYNYMYQWLLNNTGESYYINNILYSSHYKNQLPLDPQDGFISKEDLAYYYEVSIPEAGGLYNWYNRTDLSNANWINRAEYAFIITPPQGLAQILITKQKVFKYIGEHIPEFSIGFGAVVLVGGLIATAAIIHRV